MAQCDDMYVLTLADYPLFIWRPDTTNLLFVVNDGTFYLVSSDADGVFTESGLTYFSENNLIYVANGNYSITPTAVVASYFALYENVAQFKILSDVVFCTYNSTSVHTTIGFEPLLYSSNALGVVVWNRERLAFVDSYFCGVTYPYNPTSPIVSAFLNSTSIVVITENLTETITVASCQPNFRSAYPSQHIGIGNSTESIDVFTGICNINTSCSPLTEFKSTVCRTRSRCADFLFYGSNHVDRKCNPPAQQCDGYTPSGGNCTPYTQCEVVLPGNTTHDNTCLQNSGLWNQPSLCGHGEYAHYANGAFVGCVSNVTGTLCPNGMHPDRLGACPDEISSTPTICVPSVVLSTDVPDEQFMGCEFLTEVTFQATVRVLGVDSFRDTTSLMSVVFAVAPVYIQERAFYGSAIQTLHIPGPASIGAFAFASSSLGFISGNIILLEGYAFARTFYNVTLPVFVNTTVLGPLFFESVFEDRGDVSTLIFKCVNCDFALNVDPLTGGTVLAASYTNTLPYFDPDSPIISLGVYNANVDGSSLKQLHILSVTNGVVGGFEDGSIHTLQLNGVTIEDAAFYNNSIESVDLTTVPLIGACAFCNNPLIGVALAESVVIGPHAFGSTLLQSADISYCAHVDETAFDDTPCCAVCNYTAGTTISNCTISPSTNINCLNCTRINPGTYSNGQECVDCTGYCTVGQFAATYCDDTVNIICESCPPRTYQPARIHRYPSCIPTSCPTNGFTEECQETTGTIRLIVNIVITACAGVIYLVYVGYHFHHIFPKWTLNELTKPSKKLSKK